MRILGQFDIAKALLEQGADVNAENNEKSTPLHVSCRNGKLKDLYVSIKNSFL